MKVSIFEENKRLKEELEKEKRLRKEWHKKYEEIHKEYKELEKKYNQLKNSNTPSSQIPVYLKQFSITRELGKKKRGRKKKRIVNVRTSPEKHDEEVIAKADCCPKCESKKLKEKDTYSFTVYDLPKIELVYRKATVKIFGCMDCGFEFEGKHPKVPTKGQIGPGLQSLFTILKHHFGGAYGKISKFTEELTGEKFCKQTINNTISNVAETLTPSYNNMKEQVKKAKVKQSDETGWPVNGKSWWLWVIVTTNLVFLSIDKSRGSKVLKKIFGVAEDFVGVLVSDCYCAYQAYRVVAQKCWLHLLRKAKFEAKKHPKKDVKTLFESLSSIYMSMRTFLKKNPSESERILQAIIYKQKLDRICKSNWKSDSAVTLVKRIRKYISQWLVGVIIPEVPLHNNDNERPIRSLALPRKVCGGHRTEKGAVDFTIIASHLQSWRKRGMSQFNELFSFLSKSYSGLNPTI